MPYDGGARWQIDILAADKTAQAFASVDRRFAQSAQNMRRLAQEAMAAAQKQAQGFAQLAAAQPAAQAAGYARLAASTSRSESLANITRLAEQSGTALAAMYGIGVNGATALGRANEKTAQSLVKLRALDPKTDPQTDGLPVALSRGAGGMAAMLGTATKLAGVVGVLGVAWRTWEAGMASGALIDQAAQLGVTTDSLQAYRLAAAQSGVEAGQFDSVLQKLTAQVGAVRDGNDEAISRFDRLGVKILDANGKVRSLESMLPEVARGLLAVGSETERNALAQEIFGRSGSRVVTMLETLARGTDSVTAAARAQKAVVERDALEAWNKLDAQLKVTKASSDATLASLGAPIATWALEVVNRLLTDINANLAKLKMEGQTIAGRAAGVDVKHLEEQLAVQENLLKINPNNLGAKQSAEALRKRLADARLVQQMQEGADAAGVLVGDTPRYTPPNPGVSNPPAKGAAAAGAKLDERLRELQVERVALEKALAAFDAAGNESVAEVDRRLDAQVKLDKKIFDVLKDVPPNSPLAARLVQEATAISTFTQKLDEKKRLLTEGEGITQRYGDGTREAARAVAQLDRLLAANAITQGTYTVAMKATTQAADDQARAYRAAGGGAAAFIAGIEQGMSDLARANAEFELGKRIVDDTSQAITDLASGAEVDFNRILLGWITMWAQMEMRAAASSLWNMLGGEAKGGGGGGLGGLLISGISSLLGSFGGGGWEIGPVGGAYNGGGSATYGGPRAAGGRVNPGSWYMVGERGPEPFIPDSAGTVLPTDSLGGSTTVIVNQTVHIGEYVTASEHRKGLAAIKKAAEDGAYARVVDERRRGGALKKVFG